MLNLVHFLHLLYLSNTDTDVRSISEGPQFFLVNLSTWLINTRNFVMLKGCALARVPVNP